MAKDKQIFMTFYVSLITEKSSSKFMYYLTHSLNQLITTENPAKLDIMTTKMQIDHNEKEKGHSTRPKNHQIITNKSSLTIKQAMTKTLDQSETIKRLTYELRKRDDQK